MATYAAGLVTKLGDRTKHAAAKSSTVKGAKALTG